MIIVDTALEQREKEGRPVRVGIVGAGYMGRGIAAQLLKPPVGMRLAAISNRTLGKAEQALRDGGLTRFQKVASAAELDHGVTRGEVCVASDPLLLCDTANIDVVVDATSDMELGARVVLRALKSGKHVVLLNAVLDATLGPILKTYADRHNAVITYTDGDEPGVAVNLFRFVKTLGFRPVAAGNLKGLLDPYRTPKTQKAFAERVNQSAPMITSFADGTKLSMECTILANSTGLRVGKRGMYGPQCAHVKEALGLFPREQLLNGGIVDFLIGAEPHTGVFVIAHSEDAINAQYMNFFKMGDGPFYVFYTPFHLPQVQVLSTIARAALFHDATTSPIGKPVCDVLTVAKRDLAAGETLDGIGGFACYGIIENADIAQKENALPMGLSENCRLKRAIAKDSVITNADVEVPAGRLCDQLRAEQDHYFSAAVGTWAKT
jgi:predicted homoserine dehydrogenase-like protein